MAEGSGSSPVKVHIPGPASIGHAYRQGKRLKDVLAILVRNGLGDVVEAIRGERKRRSEVPTLSDAGDRSARPARVRKAIEELGPTFVKLGQVLSTRSDLLPPDYLTELTKLQDAVPPFPSEEAEALIERELGAPVDEVFETFGREPMASASLGQVHRARLDGRDVAVKIQRPGVRDTIDADVDLMMQVAALLERHVEGWDVHAPTRVVREFSATIDRELDYELEAAQQERFARQFEEDPTVFVPSVYHSATTGRVLTMDFVDGVKVSDDEGLAALGLDRKELARRGFRLVLEQALVHGFFHADPHPGNIFALPNNVVCFIDFGMMGRLSQRVRDDFVELIYHVANEDAERVARTIARLAGSDRRVDLAELEREAAFFMDSYIGRPVAAMDLGQVLREILQALARHGLRVPADLFLMLKAISEIESLAIALDPDFDLIGEAKPYVRRIFADRFRPRRIADELIGTGRELAHALRDAPDVVRELTDQARRSGLRIELVQEHTPDILRVSNQVGNRLSFAFVLGASLVGSAIVAAAEIPPLWRGVSLLGLGGFVVSLAMSFWLLMSILRHGRL